MKKFTLGMAAGAGTLALAVPLLAQMTFAANADKPFADRPVPSQACVQAMAAQADVQLKNFDAMNAQHKTALQAHQKALAAAGAIADEAQRKAALEAAHEAMRPDNAKEIEMPAEMKTAMEAVREACGDVMMFHDMRGGPGGPGMKFERKMMFKHRMGGDVPAKTESGSSSSSNTQIQ